MVKTHNKFYHLLRAVRPRQWIKNLAVYAPIVFSGTLFDPGNFYQATLAFIYFSAISSAVYLLNDIEDIEKDKLHPIKKNRPLASGALPVSWAKITAAILIIIFIPSAFSNVGSYFGFVLAGYLLLQLSYNYYLKGVIIMDALAIAFGFILRVFGGALAIPISISSWFVLAVTGASLLLAFGKRRAERTLLEAQGITKESTRQILKHYPDSLLDSMISVSATFCLISYSLFTFQVSPEKVLDEDTFMKFLPSTLIGVKLLMLTIPVVIYGVARYLYVIYEKREGESPERILLQDKPLLTAVSLLALMVIVITNAGAFF